MTPAADTPPDHATNAGWLRGPVFDTCGLAWCWLPFYLWVVFGLGLGREGWGLEPLSRADHRAALASATVVALGITYVHRHYTFLLVYGDRQTFDQRARAFVWVPLVVFAVVACARAFGGDATIRIGSTSVDGWLAILTVTGLWNVWHTIAQRYGILRVYGGRSGSGLQLRDHARRDRAMLWSGVVLVALTLVAVRPETFAGHGNARRVLRTVGPLLEHPLVQLVAAMIAIAALGVVGWWALHERRAGLSWRARVPRLGFVASTFGLFAVFLIHGPIVGYLCFGTAHAIEYVFFLHHFGHAKFSRRAAASPGPKAPPRSLAAAALARPLLFAPLLSGALVLLYIGLLDVRRTDTFLVYYTSTSLLHFLFDGWIWKVRRPEVGRPLGVTTAGTVTASGPPAP